MRQLIYERLSRSAVNLRCDALKSGHGSLTYFPFVHLHSRQRKPLLSPEKWCCHLFHFLYHILPDLLVLCSSQSGSSNSGGGGGVGGGGGGGDSCNRRRLFLTGQSVRRRTDSTIDRERRAENAAAAAVTAKERARSLGRPFLTGEKLPSLLSI